MICGKGLLCLLLLYHTGGALELIVPPTHRAQVGSNTQIPCKYKVEKLPLDLKFFEIQWHKEGKMILNYNDNGTKTDPRYSLDTETAITGVADLSISNVSGFDVGVYTCLVIYSPYLKQKDVQLDVTASPRIMISNKLILVNKKSILRSSITGFFPMDIVVKWFRDGEILDRVTVDKTLRHQDGTYSVNSSVIISPTEEDRERIFSCQVQHYSLSKPLQEDFQLVYGVPPRIIIAKNNVVINKESNLRSSIIGFYPEDIDIKWLRDGEILDRITVETSQNNSDGTYSVNSSVMITPTEEDRERIFSCRVQHQSLRGPLQNDFLLVSPDINDNSALIFAILSVLSCLLAIALIVFSHCCWPKIKNIPCCCSSPATSCHTCAALRRDKRKERRERDIERCDAEQRAETNENTEMEMFLPNNSDPDYKGTLPDPEIGEIKVEELVLGKKGSIKCPISNYTFRQHNVTWLIKEKGADEPIPVSSDNPSDVLSEQSGGQTIHIAILTLMPVKDSCDGAEFICRVELSGSEHPIQRSTGPVHVTETPKKQNEQRTPTQQNTAAQRGEDNTFGSPETVMSKRFDPQSSAKKQMPFQTPEKGDTERLKENNGNLSPVNESLGKEEKAETVVQSSEISAGQDSDKETPKKQNEQRTPTQQNPAAQRGEDNTFGSPEPVMSKRFEPQSSAKKQMPFQTPEKGDTERLKENNGNLSPVNESLEKEKKAETVVQSNEISAGQDSDKGGKEASSSDDREADTK